MHSHTYPLYQLVLAAASERFRAQRTHRVRRGNVPPRGELLPGLRSPAALARDQPWGMAWKDKVIHCDPLCHVTL